MFTQRYVHQSPPNDTASTSRLHYNSYNHSLFSSRFAGQYLVLPLGSLRSSNQQLVLYTHPMQTYGSTPKKQASKRAPPATDSATRKIIGKAEKNSAEDAQADGQVLNGFTKKRKNHPDRPKMAKRKEFIDLTGDDSTVPAVPGKAQKSTAKKENTFSSNQRLTNQQRVLPSYTAAIRPRSTQNRNRTMPARPNQPQSTPERPSKRARCEVASDDDADTAFFPGSIKNYYLAPPGSRGTVTANTTADSDAGLTRNLNTGGSHSLNSQINHLHQEPDTVPMNFGNAVAFTSDQTSPSSNPAYYPFGTTHQRGKVVFQPDNATHQLMNPTRQVFDLHHQPMNSIRQPFDFHHQSIKPTECTNPTHVKSDKAATMPNPDQKSNSKPTQPNRKQPQHPPLPTR